MNVLAIGCHPDDIEISCCGTLAKCVKRGDKVTVCHVANGNMGHEIIKPDELRVMRANEAKTSGAMVGFEVFWGGFDDVAIYADNKEARDKVVEVIKEVEVKYVPWYHKLLSALGLIALVFFGVKIYLRVKP